MMRLDSIKLYLFDLANNDKVKKAAVTSGVKVCAILNTFGENGFLTNNWSLLVKVTYKCLKLLV